MLSTIRDKTAVSLNRAHEHTALSSSATSSSAFFRPLSYSYASAEKKITLLAALGYRLIGSLPSNKHPWSALKLGCFLFLKNKTYYAYAAKALLSDASFNLTFDIYNEPSPGKNFQKIIDDDFIYVIIIEKAMRTHCADQITVLIRRDALLQGHQFLVGPYALNCPLFATTQPYNENTLSVLSKELDTLDCAPQAAYLLCQEVLYYVKKAGQIMFQQRLEDFSSNLINLIQNELHLDLHKLKENELICLGKRLPALLIQAIQQATQYIPYSITGGELFYFKEQIALINCKSGSFPTPPERTIATIKKVLGEHAASQFHSAVEKNEVSAEIKRRCMQIAEQNLKQLPKQEFINKENDLSTDLNQLTCSP
ncbi:MAG: hypothetical protein PSV35_00440 [bacterium]|nr:hypothetical protein [bacterium]